MESLEPPLRRTLPECRPGSHRRCNAVEVECSEVFKVEQIAQELPCRFSDDYGVRLCDALQTRRKVRRLAHNGLFLRSSRPDQIAHDHKPCGDAYASLKRLVRVEPTHS